MAPDALDCPKCHWLIHEAAIERTAARARAFEANGSLHDAAEQWQAALALLPPDSKQAEWIHGHLRELKVVLTAPGAPDTRRKWVKWLGPLAPIALFLAKFKVIFFAIFKFKFLFSFMAFIGVYWSFWGWKFGVGFAVLILIHEMGHFIDVKRRGLPAEMPVFLPGLGAYVKWQAMGVPLETRAAVSLAGPLAGWFAAGICALLWFHTGNHLWAGLAGVSAWLNALNLIPVWILDGGGAVLALSKRERALLMVVAVALGAALGHGVFYFVAGGALLRLFTKDEPPHSSPGTTAYYVAVLAALGLVMWMIPSGPPGAIGL